MSTELMLEDNVVLRTEVGIELRSVLYIGKVKEGPFF